MQYHFLQFSNMSFFIISLTSFFLIIMPCFRIIKTWAYLCYLVALQIMLLSSVKTASGYKTCFLGIIKLTYLTNVNSYLKKLFFWLGIITFYAGKPTLFVLINITCVYLMPFFFTTREFCSDRFFDQFHPATGFFFF